MPQKRQIKRELKTDISVGIGKHVASHGLARADSGGRDCVSFIVREEPAEASSEIAVLRKFSRS